MPLELLVAIKADLAGRLSIHPQAITLVKAEAVTWGDGSLGCPAPGEAFTQVLVDGYHIILAAETREYDYRASQSGFFKLCQSGPSGPGRVPPAQP